MMRKMFNIHGKRFLASALVLCMLLSYLTVFPLRAEAVDMRNLLLNRSSIKEYDRNSLDLDLRKDTQSDFLELEIDPEEEVRVLIIMEDKSVLEQIPDAQINDQTKALSEDLLEGQNAVLNAIAKDILEEEALEINSQYTWLLNGVAATVPYGSLRQISKVDGVKRVLLQTVYEICKEDPFTNSDGIMIGREDTWASGYTGQGTKIAIIDTGIDDDHPSFAALPELSAEEQAIYDRTTVDDIAAVLDELQAAKLYKDLSAEDVYFNSKIAFGFNYVDRTLQINHSLDQQGDHGTHVAGIAAANDLGNGGAVGVAPDAQLYVMKVFGVNGGAWTEDILCALEDALKLGADVINMSLGSPAGFTSSADEINQIYQSISNYTTLVFVSAGNEDNAGVGSAWGIDQNLISNPDNAVIASPGIYQNVNSVASVNNLEMMGYFLGVDGQYVSYFETLHSNQALETLAGEDYAYAMVGNMGQTLEDFQAAGVEGKIAVVSRGVSSFVEKHEMAQAAGAIACVVYNNVNMAPNEYLYMDLSASTATIPAVFITLPDGEFLAAALEEDPETTMYVSGLEKMPGEDAGKMSVFSSWGPTPSLTLEPDLTAPGGNIYSTLDGGGYGVMSGTSMASPNAAGIAALVLQYLKATYGSMETAELRQIANGLLYSAAVPIEYADGVPYSPRIQGTGLLNAYNSVNSTVYLTVPGMDVPKVELGDDPGKTGVYTFTFGAENMDGEQDQYFAVSVGAQTEGIDTYFDEAGNPYDFMSGRPEALSSAVVLNSANMVLTYDYTENGKANSSDARYLYLETLKGDLSTDDLFFRYNLNADEAGNRADVQAYLDALVKQPWSDEEMLEDEVLKVGAGESASVTATVTLSSEDIEYLNQFVNGIYVEGFAMLDAKNQSGVDLSLPYLGFYGDWTQAPVLDTGYFVGYSDDRQMVFSDYSTYPNMLMSAVGGAYGLLGDNPYIYEEFDERYISLSPNDDGYMDFIEEITIGLLRNAKELTISYTDAETGELYYELIIDEVRKTLTYLDITGEYVTDYFSLYALYYNYGELAYYYLVNEAGEYLPNNTKLLLTISAKQEFDDHAPNCASDTWTVPITIDTEAPTVDVLNSKLTVNEDGTQILDISFSDNVGVAAVNIVNAKTKQVIATSGVEHVAPGEMNHITMDVTMAGNDLWVVLGDYAMNESLYQIHTTDNEEPLDMDALFAYRMYTEDMRGAILGWMELDPETAEVRAISADETLTTAITAAAYVDGYIITCDFSGIISYIEPGNWTERNYITQLPKYYADCMTFDPTTGNVYLYSYRSDALYAFNVETGELSTISSYMYPKLVGLAVDDEGTLYGMSVYGELYTFDKQTGYRIDYTPVVTLDGIYTNDYQGMTYDPDDDCIYWAYYWIETDYEAQTQIRHNMLYRIDLSGETVTVEEVGTYGYKDQLTGLLKMDDRGYQLPVVAKEDIQVKLDTQRLNMMLGGQAQLTAMFQPWYETLEGLVWTSSDPSVAVVDQNGAVIAMAPGKTIVTVSSADGSTTAECEVFVADLRADLHAFIGVGNSVLNQWICMPSYDLYESYAYTQSGNTVFRAAEYVNGDIYAYTTMGDFYRLDAETMTGTKLSGYHGTYEVVDLAYDYSTGFMYGLISELDYYTYTYDVSLTRVDLNTGTMDILGIVTGAEGGMPVGLAASTDGVLYIVDEDGLLSTVDPATCAATLVGNTGYNAPYQHALVYDHDYGNLYWSMGLAHMIYIDENTADAMEIGSLDEAASAVAMFIIPANEPTAPEVEAESVTMLEDHVLVLEGMSIGTPVKILPLNTSDRGIVWTLEDETVATVADGVITGLKAGTTKAVGKLGDFTVEMTVEVLKSSDNLQGYLVAELGAYEDSNAWIALKDNDMASGYIPLTDITEYGVIAAEYYNGKIYAYNVIEEFSYVTYEFTYEYLLQIIDPATYAVEDTITLSSGAYMTDLAFSYADNTMYAIGARTANTVAEALYMINPITGDVCKVATLETPLIALACAADGTLYGICQGGILYKVDGMTGTLTKVGDTGYNDNSWMSSMTYDYETGNLYWVQSDSAAERGHLMIVDPKDASVLNLGFVGVNGCDVCALFTIPNTDPEAGTPEVGGMLLNKESVTLAVGDQTKLSVTLLPLSITPVEGTVTFSSSDETVVTVDSDGVITAVSKGSAVITVTCGAFTKTCQVQVAGKDKLLIVTDSGLQSSPAMAPDNVTDVFTISDDNLSILSMTWDAEEECYYALCSSYLLDDYYLVKIDTEGNASIVDENQKVFGFVENGNDFIYPMDEIYEENMDLVYNPFDGKLYMMVGVSILDEEYWDWYDVYAVYTVDEATGASQFLAMLPSEVDETLDDCIYNPNDFVFIDADTMVVLDYGMDRLWKVDLDVVNGTTSGTVFAEDEDYVGYDPAGIAYHQEMGKIFLAQVDWYGSAELWTVDVVTGVMERVGDAAYSGDMVDMILLPE